jgi:serine/threonine protein phosphatase PrpC
MPYPGIVVSRAFGDNVAARLGVTHTPDVLVRPWVAGDRFLIIASDGLWDALTPKGAVKAAGAYVFSLSHTDANGQ